MAMTAVLAEHELFDSCRVLFGSELQVSRAFLEYLQRSGIKTAYRKKALETHPDVLASHGPGAERQSADLFRVVQQAYEHLITYLDARDSGFRFPASTPVRTRRTATAPVRPQAKPAPRPQARSWNTTNAAYGQSARTQTGNFGSQSSRPSSAWQTGPTWPSSAIPARRLLFGHYLYYSGATNWQTIIKALVWQRTGRPRLGEIGRRFGWLSDRDILTILKSRKLSEPFGTSAVSLGLLTDKQLKLMIFQQNKLQKKFGEYFIQHNLLSPGQINELVNQFTRHNTYYTPRRYAYSSS